MSDAYDSGTWYSSDASWSWSEYGQNRRIRRLQEELAGTQAAQAASTRRLRSELSKLSGGLEQKLDRLSAAFDAFVEISDLRLQLAVHDEPAAVRRRTKQLLLGIAGTVEVPPAPGYWLAPALSALQAVLAGADPAAQLAEAAAADASRSALFHLLTCALFGHGATVPTESLGTAFGTVGAEITLAQRAVWTLGADGHYGAAGRTLVQRALGEHVATLTDDARDAQVGAWCTAVRPDDTTRVLPAQETRGKDNVAEILGAADQLAVLRRWLTARLAEPGPAGAPDPLVRRAVELLVDEGSPAERPLLARERELRKVIENGSGAPVQNWDDPAGGTLELLRADVQDDAHPGRAVVAVRACAPHVLAAADLLAERAGGPVPTQITVRTRRGAVKVGRSGPDQSDVDRTVRGLAEYEMGRVAHRRNAYVAAGVAVALLALGFAAWVVFVFAAVAAGVAVWCWRADGRARIEAQQVATTTRALVQQSADEQAALFAAARKEIDERRPAVAEDRVAVTALLS